MKIVVCIKQVPDTKGGVKFNPDGTLDRGAMLTIMNPDDKAGLEAALRIKDEYGAEVTVLTMGLPKADEVLREAMAMGADKEILVTIQKTIMASPDLRNKKDLIMAFIESLDQDSNVYADFESFMSSKKKEELDKIIAEENLNKEETYNFIQRSFEQGRVETNGTEVSTILPPMSMFTPNNDRQEKKNKVIDKLLEFFDKFFSISSNRL